MEKLKDIDYKILFELMRNSKVSDRELAKKSGVSCFKKKKHDGR